MTTRIFSLLKRAARPDETSSRGRLLPLLALLVLCIFPSISGAGPQGKGQKAPRSTSPPTISGSAVVGSTLSGTTGSWGGGVASYAYQWLRCDTAGAACSAIAGASTAAYVPTTTDAGSTFVIAVTASNAGGSSVATSAATAVVTAASATSQSPSNTSPPAIIGDAVVGDTLSASSGTWSSGSLITYAYQWRRCGLSGTNCASISGATAANYAPGTQDVGSTLDVVVAGSNYAGTATAVSAPTAPVSGTSGTTSATTLAWAPPLLLNPITVNVPSSGGYFKLDPTRDYVVSIGDVSAVGGVILDGGHNVVLEGGHITIPWAGSTPSPADRRALEVKNQTGTMHIEGLLIDNQGGDLGEGIQIADQNAIVQIENVRVTDIHARDEVGFTDTHPDVIQPWGGYRELRVDHLTGRSDYQGIFLKAESGYSLGKSDLRNVNLIALPTAHYLFWQELATTPVALSGFWMDVSQSKFPLGWSVYPDTGKPLGRQATLSAGGTSVSWTSSNISGSINGGAPPGGDFVPSGEAGVGYTSPGYVG